MICPHAHLGRMRRLTLGALWVILSLIQPAAAADEWAFQLSPYAWLAGMKGNTGKLPDGTPVYTEVSPSDVVEDVEATLMLIFNANRGAHGIYTDIFFADIQSDEEVLPPPVDLSLKVRAKNTVVSVAYQYQFFRSEAASAELMVGARYWDTEAQLNFKGGGGLLEGQRLSSSDSWVDPLLGIKGSFPLGDSRFYFVGGGAIGGFNVGSDWFYEVSGAVGYRWTDSIATAVGYRLFDVDYDNDDFLYDITQQGWQIGLSWSF